jgi:outer membrane protein OmpA-like peptidoglycan-associated protein
MEGGGREQNFWPGFVDALSNVVLVMIFVVVVFVVTLFYYSQKLAQFKAIKFLEKTQQTEQTESPAKSAKPELSQSDDGGKPDSSSVKVDNAAQSKEIAALKGQIAELKIKLAASSNTAVPGSLQSDESAPTKVIQVEKTKKSTAPDSPQGIKIDSLKDAVTLHFDRDGVELNADATKTLDNNLKRWAERLKAQPQGKLIITGVVGTVSYTEGRRRAYYRAVAVRNYLIDLGITPTNVVSRVVPGTESVESDSTVIIQYAASAK